jgi:hypothetical protein
MPKKKKGYLFFSKQTVDFMNGTFVKPFKKAVKSKKFKRGY